MNTLIPEANRLIFTIFGTTVQINLDMLIMTWFVMAVLIILAYLATRNLKEIPGKIQSVFELFVDVFKDMVISTLGEEDGPKYVPLIASIFIFVLISNWVGVIPDLAKFVGFVIALVLKPLGLTAAQFEFRSIVNIAFIPPQQEWYSFLFRIPAFHEPTRYLATDLGLGLLVAFVVHTSAIRAKGLGGYLKSYAEPIFLLAPLNLIGEVAKVISHSFRLFGNILGGSIIIIIVSRLVLYIGLPVFLNLFFGLFVGAIQAFVFAMLAVTYIAVAVK